jgi:hypothetical protein
MRVFRFAVSILSSLVLLTAFAPPAQAAVPHIPLTCGLVVEEDAVVYLAHDLTCPDFGVRVVAPPAEPGPGPHVKIDLRGHTLRGSGTAFGISANNAGSSDFITVINGRLKGWDTAISGDYETRTRNVSLIGNRVGFFCSGLCVANRTTFKSNTDTGLFVGGQGTAATVTRSSFVNNGVGASVLAPWNLSIEHSVFRKNQVGLLDGGAVVPVSKSLFVKNRVAIRVESEPGDGACVDLHKVLFVKNGVGVDGATC